MAEFIDFVAEFHGSAQLFGAFRAVMEIADQGFSRGNGFKRLCEPWPNLKPSLTDKLFDSLKVHWLYLQIIVYHGKLTVGNEDIARLLFHDVKQSVAELYQPDEVFFMVHIPFSVPVCIAQNMYVIFIKAHRILRFGRRSAA